MGLLAAGPGLQPQCRQQINKYIVIIQLYCIIKFRNGKPIAAACYSPVTNASIKRLTVFNNCYKNIHLSGTINYRKLTLVSCYEMNELLNISRPTYVLDSSTCMLRMICM